MALFGAVLLLLPSPRALAQDGPACPRGDAGRGAEELALEATGLEKAGNFGALADLYRRALERRKAAGCEGAAELHRLHGQALYRAGRPAEAEEELRTAVALHQRAGGERLALAQNDLGAVLRDLGRYEAAEITLNAGMHALDATAQEHRATRATIHNNLAGLCYYRSDYRRAVEHYRTALELFRGLEPEGRDVAMVLNNLGLMQQELGDADGAEAAYRRSLELKERLFGPAHPSTASTVENLAAVLDGRQEFARAEPLHARAAMIYERVSPTHPKLSEVLQAWGESRLARGDTAGARDMLRRALRIREAAYGPASAWTGETLSALASVESLWGSHVRAEALLRRSLSIAVASGEDELLHKTWSRMREVLSRSGAPSAAVFFGKQAVNLLQRLRSDLGSLGRPVQQSFLARREQTYRAVLEQLISLGRLGEAEEVMRMLKEEEYFDFVRSALDGRDSGRVRASFSAAEVPLDRSYGAAVARLAAAGTALRNAPPAEIETRTMEVQARSREHEAALRRTILALRGASRRPAADVAGSRVLLPPGVATLRYLVTGSQVRILVTTGTGRRAFHREIGAAELNRRIFDLRQAMQDPRSDPASPARALFEILIRPAEAFLESQRVERLLLAPDGPLALVPFAALHDGTRYLVEHRAVALLTLGGQADEVTSPEVPERIAAFGTSRAISEFPALPRVASELEQIVRRTSADPDGVIPGVVFLDGEFTAQRLFQVLGEGYPVVHVASHFVFRPGPLDRSFLVLGDGNTLTLEQLKERQPRLSDVRLLALSACSTAMSESGNRGLESFATLVQRLGARRVLATLWQVGDLSGAALAARFYAERERVLGDEIQALARVQRSFLAPGAPPSWRHPYHWASVVVLGSP